MSERTLGQHGLAYRFNGIPWFDDDGEVAGVVDEPLWDEKDLTPDHLAELEAEVDEWVANGRKDRREMARYWILEHNGVRHTHVRGRWLREERHSAGWECRFCLGYIVPKDPPEDFRFFGGPADGQWLVTGGAPYWRVPIIQPISVLAANEAPSPSMDVATYVLRREVGYVLVP